MKVLYLAVEEIDYPRNVRIRSYLEARGAKVTVVTRPARDSKIREYLALLREGLRYRKGYDLVILSEFSTNSFPISWLIARLNGAVHAVDFFVGKYETIVEDRRKFGPGHVLAHLLLFLDRSAIRSADIAFADTAVRAMRFTKLARNATPIVNLPVGAPDWARGSAAPPARGAGSPLDVLYYGHYAPLHGVDVLLDGIVGAGQVIPIRATFVGEGTAKEQLVAEVRRLGLSKQINFVGYEAPAELMQRVARSDVVLGVFGSSSKAGSVIANKVWQGLYAGKVVITRRSEALSEIDEISGSHLVQVEPGNSTSIVEGLTKIYHDRSQTELSPSRSMAEMLEEYVIQKFNMAFEHPVFQGHHGIVLDPIELVSDLKRGPVG